ncbi:hypothetical protein BHE74_00007748 [Ensete ventricosum]|nr:hypothetical protein BHE74_00007748 [Ensete ventricosum]RZR93617.1 hypothetical protein BHM03_00022158 [Ensete ventricosum]
MRKVKFQSVFRAPSPKFKILAIPNVLAQGKSYEHGFMKKCDNHKVYTKSRAKSIFNRFFMHHLEIKNTGLSQCISPCSKIQNTGHSQCISPSDVVRAWFHEKK